MKDAMCSNQKEAFRRGCCVMVASYGTGLYCMTGAMQMPKECEFRRMI